MFGGAKNLGQPLFSFFVSTQINPGARVFIQ
jgi:hypothetical protein